MCVLSTVFVNWAAVELHVSLLAVGHWSVTLLLDADVVNAAFSAAAKLQAQLWSVKNQQHAPDKMLHFTAPASGKLCSPGTAVAGLPNRHLLTTAH